MFNKFRFWKKPYCLVLGGGGNKGVYQMGVWKALMEDHIRIEAIIGTSVGSVNAAFMASSDYKRVLDGWMNMDATDVFILPDGKLGRFTVLKEITKQMLTKGGMDMSRFRQYISQFIDEARIRKSGIDLGIVTFNINDLKPIEYFLENIPDGELITYVMASSGLPGLQPNIINDKLFADGGFYDVIPYNTARKRGYNRIIVVDISGIGHDKKDNNFGAETVFIKNSQDTGEIISFDHQVYERNVRMGYLDTRKAFGHYNSDKYFFRINRRTIRSIDKLLTDDAIFDQYSRYMSLTDTDDTGRRNRLKLVRKTLPPDRAIHRIPEAMLIECAAEALNIDTLQHDNVNLLINEIKNRLSEIRSAEHSDKDTKNVFDKIQRFGKIINTALFAGNELIDIMLTEPEALKHLKFLSGFYPNLVPALIFLTIVEKL